MHMHKNPTEPGIAIGTSPRVFVYTLGPRSSSMRHTEEILCRFALEEETDVLRAAG